MLKGDRKIFNLFPRQAFICGSTRMKNLMEILSPTQQHTINNETPNKEENDNIEIVQEDTIVETQGNTQDSDCAQANNRYILDQEDIISLQPKKWITENVIWSYINYI